MPEKLDMAHRLLAEGKGRAVTARMIGVDPATLRRALNARGEARIRAATAYLKNGGTLKKAAMIANHASTRTTQLYDRRSDEVSLDEVERILI